MALLGIRDDFDVLFFPIHERNEERKKERVLLAGPTQQITAKMTSREGFRAKRGKN
jgi:hypothetical protein